MWCVGGYCRGVGGGDHDSRDASIALPCARLQCYGSVEINLLLKNVLLSLFYQAKTRVPCRQGGIV